MIYFRPRKSDLEVLVSVVEGEYQALEGHVDPSFSGLIVDAGAYIGISTVWLSSMFPSATIVAIEPDHENFKFLAQNTARCSNVYRLQAALVPHCQAGELMALRDRFTGAWGYSVVDGVGDAIGVAPGISLHSISKYFGFSNGVLKLDIEGGEYALLKNDAEQLRHWTFVIAELHERIVPGVEALFLDVFRDRKIEGLGGEKVMTVSGWPRQS